MDKGGAAVRGVESGRFVGRFGKGDLDMRPQVLIRCGSRTGALTHSPVAHSSTHALAHSPLVTFWMYRRRGGGVCRRRTRAAGRRRRVVKGLDGTVTATVAGRGTPEAGMPGRAGGSTRRLGVQCRGRMRPTDLALTPMQECCAGLDAAKLGSTHALLRRSQTWA